MSDASYKDVHMYYQNTCIKGYLADKLFVLRFTVTFDLMTLI